MVQAVAAAAAALAVALAVAADDNDNDEDGDEAASPVLRKLCRFGAAARSHAASRPAG